MENIPNKTDLTDTLPAADFNSHKNELQVLVTESGQTLDVAKTDQLRKAISTFGRAMFTSNSGTADALVLSRPTTLTDIDAYYDGMVVMFDSANPNTGNVTANLATIGVKKVLDSFENELPAGTITANNLFILVYREAFDSAIGAFEFTGAYLETQRDKSTTHNITTDANYTLTATQNKFGAINITDTGVVLTTPRDIIIDNIEHNEFIFSNNTLQDLTVKTAAGTGIIVLASATKKLRNDGTDVVDIEVVLSYGDSDVLSLFNVAGSAPVFAIRGWIKFTGTGTPTIDASGNISSLVDNGTGNFTINLTTNIEDVDYSAVGISGGDSDAGRVTSGITDVTVSSFRYITMINSSTTFSLKDWAYNAVTITR